MEPDFWEATRVTLLKSISHKILFKRRLLLIQIVFPSWNQKHKQVVNASSKMVESLHINCCLSIICIRITVLGMCYNYGGLEFVKLQLKHNFHAEIWLNSVKTYSKMWWEDALAIISGCSNNKRKTSLWCISNAKYQWFINNYLMS